jgi:RNA polymerase primary sigma factor
LIFSRLLFIIILSEGTGNKEHRGSIMTETNKELAVIEMYMKDVENIPQISDEEKEDLITRLADGDSSVVEDLVNSMLLHVAEMAQNYRDKGVSFSDLIQEGNVALTEVISDYDGDADLESFNEMVDEAVTEAFESAIEEQAASDKISQRLADKLNLLDDTTKRLTEKLGRVPEASELAKEMDIPEEEVDNLLKISLDVLSVNEDSHLADDIDSSIDEVDEDISDEDPLDWSFDS